MGYNLQAFICKKEDTELLTYRFAAAKKVSMGQGLDIIPMTEELFDEINNMIPSESIDKFVFMTEHLEQEILKTIGAIKFAYVEADYFGGIGGQTAIVWNKKIREHLFEYGQGKINLVLKNFGVIANPGIDEFLTLGFELRRDTKEWFEMAK